MREIGPEREQRSRFGFAGVHVGRGIGFPDARDFAREGLIAARLMQVDDVVALVFELRLHEEAQEVRVPAVAVHDEDLLEAVAGDLGARRVEQVPDQPRRQRKRARSCRAS